MRYKNWAIASALALSPIGFGQPKVVVSGLQAPQKFTLTAGGNFLVTETNPKPNQGRVSFVSRSGVRRSFIENLPSGTEVTGGGSGPTGIALRGRTLYLAIGAGDTERRGDQAGTSKPNPEGASSPIFSSIIEFRFDADIDSVGGTFTFTPAIQQQLADGQQITFSDGAGAEADVRMLADFPDSLPGANTIYRFSNPWGLTVDEEGRNLWVVDAYTNAVIRVDAVTGCWERMIRFPPRPNTAPVGPPAVEAVPTSVHPFGSYLLVSFLTGFPFVPDTAQVMLLDPQARTASPYLQWFSSVTDIAWRNGPASPQFFVLEFSRNQSATPPAPGRLSRIEAGQSPVVLASAIPAAVALALDESGGAIYVLSLTGQIFEIKL